MSEKEIPESAEEVNKEISETDRELEASAEETQVEGEEMEASSNDLQEEAEVAAEEVEEEAPQNRSIKKGLMERRPSFSQSSVPNAHRGYSGTPPIIMLLIISVFLLLSIIFATSAVIN
jgi:hypothetical protein